MEKVKFPIAVKLSIIISLILGLSLTSICALVSVVLTKEIQRNLEDYNWTLNHTNASACNQYFNDIRLQTSLFLSDTLNSTGKNGKTDTGYFFSLHKEFFAVVLVGAGNDSSALFVNSAKSGDGTALYNFKNPGSLISAYLQQNEDAVEKVSDANVIIRNASTFFGMPLLVMMFPFSSSTNRGVACLFFSYSDFERLFNSTAFYLQRSNTSFMLNENGDVIFHTNPAFVTSFSNFNNIPYISNLLAQDNKNLQTRFKNTDGKMYVGAFEQMNNADILVVTTIKESYVLEEVQKVTLRNIVISISVIILSIFFASKFSNTLSRPVEGLRAAAERMEKGDYNINFNYKNHDEIGVLADSFVGMANGVKNFERFSDKTIVKLAREGALTLSGASRIVSISFLYIRNFDEFTKNANAADTVQFVNSYLSHIVPCITNTGGIVDKYLTQDGVVVMALWGSVSEEEDDKAAALNSVRAALLIREAIFNWNKKRIEWQKSHEAELSQKGRSTSPIKLGCGINIGEVVQGQMGSPRRMEYTVIGDAVNLAARFEGPNDLFDTDILVTENIMALIGDKLITEELQRLEVKGKEQKLRVFAVVNEKNKVNVRSLDEVRKLWSIK